jgi:hypothetical protein
MSAGVVCVVGGGCLYRGRGVGEGVSVGWVSGFGIEWWGMVGVVLWLCV